MEGLWWSQEPLSAAGRAAIDAWAALPSCNISELDVVAGFC